MIADSCPKGQPCTFLGKIDGKPKYQYFEELASHNLTHKPILKPEYSSWQDPAIDLYVTIASYRDKLCPVTLVNMYTKALHPERVFVGVVQQNDPNADLDCLDHYCLLMGQSNSSYVDHCPFKDNIRMTRVEAREAQGPTWARAKGSLMLREEEFCMQIDAHMDFLPNWDQKMVEMWTLTLNEYAVLSTYVASSDTYKHHLEGEKGTSDRFEVPHLCMVTFGGSSGMIRVWGTKCMANMPHPKLTNIVWGAGLSFSKCHAERKVPYDPHTPGIFDGEEYSRAIRFWTWGYDVYTPHRVYVVHNYHDSQSDPKHFGWSRNSRAKGSIRAKDKDQEEGKESKISNLGSVQRLKTLVGMKVGGATDPQEVLALQQSRYGLGDRRTLDQATAFSGIDTRNREILENRCGNLDYVPFVEHPWGPEYVPRYDEEEVYQDVRDPGSIYFEGTAEELRALEQR